MRCRDLSPFGVARRALNAVGDHAEQFETEHVRFELAGDAADFEGLRERGRGRDRGRARRRRTAGIVPADPARRMLLPTIRPPNTSDSTLPSNVSTLSLSVTPGTWRPACPENSGQPNAFASSGMLIGSTLPLNATSMLSPSRLPSDSVSMASAPSNTGSLVGFVTRKPAPCARNSIVAAPPDSPYAPPFDHESFDVGALAAPAGVQFTSPFTPDRCRRSFCHAARCPGSECSAVIPLSRTASLPVKPPPVRQVAQHAGGGQRDLHVAGVARRGTGTSRAGSPR